MVINDTARLNGFHPVRDYLDALQWDGMPRVDKWLITYAGAEDSKYTRAVGALADRRRATYSPAGLQVR